MVLMDKKMERWYCSRDDVVLYAKEERWEGIPTADDTGSYSAVYIDGYGDARPSEACIELRAASFHITLGDLERHLEFPYTRIEVLNVSQEREITALRTFLIGPVLAAAFKKGTLLPTIGFRDDKGLLQLPMFRIDRDTVYKCYATIAQKIPKRRFVGFGESSS